MKGLLFAITAIVGFGLLGLTGCKKEGGIDTAKVESAFQTAAAVDKTEVEKAITAVKAGEYSGALASLQKVAASVNLTPEQKSAIADLINEVKAKVGAAAKQAVDDASKTAQEGAGKAAGDLQKAVGK
jgi:cytochrome c-type biogenesis protein CcmH/NrfG